MGFLIPGDAMTPAEIRALRQEIAAKLIKMASDETGRPASDFVVRDIEPKADLGFNLPRFENQTARSSVSDLWVSDFTKALPKSQFACFYGVIDHAVAAKPGVGAAEGFPILGVSYRMGTAGATVLEQVHLQEAQIDFYLTSNFAKFPVGYHKPVYYKGVDTINVQYVANADVAQYADQIELLGLICEPFGNTISAPDKDFPDNTSYIVPEVDMTPADIKALRELTRMQLLQIAVAQTGKALGDFVVRDIFPYADLGFNGTEWQNQTAIGAASTWTKDWSKELPKTQFIGFFGYFHQTAVAGPTGQKYTGLSYRLGGSGSSTLKQVHLQKCQRGCITSVGVTKTLRGYHNPVIYRGADTIYISLEADATVTQYYQQIGLMGLLAEPYGPTISGPQ